MVHYIPSTYLSYNWKFLPFDHLHPIPPTLATSGNHKSDLHFFKIFGCIGSLLLRVGFSLVAASRSYSLLQWLLLVRSMGSGCTGFSSCGSWALEPGSVVVAHRLSCSMACGIFPDQGLNPCPLHWQADC